ncbi:MAG TPA: FAD-binding oxidoreductase [Solirubrobacteraceae bacterium]|nr:FAD-binding oxidoreductase [Solirubrobacteraceae bacterium]
MGDPWRIADPLSFQEPYEVLEIRPRTASIVELWLAPHSVPLQYLPGEYVLLEDRAGAVPPRSYSIANAPHPDGLISLLVTRVPGGATSTWVHTQLRLGDQVSVSGPYGTFVDDPATAAPALFLAAGSGLAPIRALLQAARVAATRRSLSLIFSARTEADVIDRERFTAWDMEHFGFRFVRTLTRGAGPPPHGWIPALLGDLYDDLAGHDVFIAGAPGFVRACATAAGALGAARRSVHTEVFFVEPQPWTAMPLTPMQSP